MKFKIWIARITWFVAVAGVAGRATADSPPAATPQTATASFPVEETIRRLIEEEDTDGDAKITVDDPRVGRGRRGDRRFAAVDASGVAFDVVGTYPLSNLLQELTLAKQNGRRHARLDPGRIFEPPTRRISRLIREQFWEGLTRRVDARALLTDEKAETGTTRYLYVPHHDAIALEFYREAALADPDRRIEVVRLPEKITPAFVRSLDGKHGLLSLALSRTPDGGLDGVPFVVPGGRFNEMYGWDSYFIILGLLADGRVDLARGMVDNLVYQVRSYGKVLNANRTYYLTRSQPPFLTSAALAVFGAQPQTRESRDWLAAALRAAIGEYRDVWDGPERRTPVGLARYHGAGIGPPPEVEPGHFDATYLPFARRAGLEVAEYARRYRSGFEPAPPDDAVHEPALDRFFVNDRAVRESGHDTTYRWGSDAETGCADHATVDLNCLLYKTEIDLSRAIKGTFGGRLPGLDGPDALAETWDRRASDRKERIFRHLYDSELGLFFDFNFVTGKRSTYLAATTLYPLWACHPDDPATRLLTSPEAVKLVRRALERLETPGGVVGSDEASRGPIDPTERPERQWDSPFGWAPHQMLAWRGLLNYGLERDAQRLAYKWLYTVTRNAVDYNGTVAEKFDVVKRSHKVFAEYGNVGTEFSYITREGFGWTNASYQVGLGLLPDDLRAQLDRLVPPEWLTFDD